MNYLLDTNTLSGRVDNHPKIAQRMRVVIQQGHIIAICQPVYYEVLRGLLKKNATAQIKRLDQFIQGIAYIELENADWLQAAHFWAQMKNIGKQFSDNDLLIASVAHRITATLVTSDQDFIPLPIKREDWRNP